MVQQRRTRSSAERFAYQGEMLSIRELSARTGVTVHALRYRIKVAGMSVEEAVEDGGLQSADYQDEGPPETFDYHGEDLTLNELAKKVGVSKSTLYQRLKVLGWTMEEATGKRPRIKPNAHMMTAGTMDEMVTKSMKEWSEDLGIPMSTISRRLGLGWTDNEALGFEKNTDRVRAAAVKAAEASRIARQRRKDMVAMKKSKKR